jgi:hypothetical protein
VQADAGIGIENFLHLRGDDVRRERDRKRIRLRDRVTGHEENEREKKGKETPHDSS